MAYDDPGTAALSVAYAAALLGTVAVALAAIAAPVAVALARPRGAPARPLPWWGAAVVVAAAAAALTALWIVNEHVLLDAGMTSPSQLAADAFVLAVTGGLAWAALRRGARSAGDGRAPRALRGAGWALAAAWPVAAFAPFAATGPASAAGGDPARPNVLLVSLDTLRADHVSCYGYGRATTPNLDALAAEGLVFRRAYSATSMSLASHATMLTGLHPLEHRALTAHGSVEARGIPESVDTLAEALSRRGYRTGAFIANPWLAPVFGFAQGFGDFFNLGRFHRRSTFDPVAAFESSVVGAHAVKVLSRLAPEPGILTEERARRWLRRNARAPFFCFLHVIEIHTPYRPLPPFDEAFAPDVASPRRRGSRLPGDGPHPGPLAPGDLEVATALYDGEIRFVDEALGRVLAELDALGVADRTLVVVTSDHGEILGEGAPHFSHWGTSEAATRVPLVMRFPPGGPTGVVEDIAEAVDVVPTILGHLRTVSLHELRGRDHTGYFTPKEDPAERFTVVTSGDGTEAAVITREWRYTRARDGAATLRRDGETTGDRSAEHPEVAGRLAATLARWVEQSARFTPGDDVSVDDLDREARDLMKTLGYIR